MDSRVDIADFGPGEYEFPFSVRLPASLPPTFCAVALSEGKSVKGLEKKLRDGVSLRRIDSHLSMYHWDLATYRREIAAAGLVLEDEIELTDVLVRGFQSSNQWFEVPAGSNALARGAARAVGRGLVALYRWELRNRYHYTILAGSRP